MILLQSRSGSDHGKRQWFVCIAVWVLAVWCAAAQAQGIPPELEQAWKATRLPGSALALHVQEVGGPTLMRSEEHTSELQSLMRISYAVFCLKKKKLTNTTTATYKYNI